MEVLIIEEETLDLCDVVEFVQIDFFVCLKVAPSSILRICTNEIALVGVTSEVQWHRGELELPLMDDLNLTRLEVECEYLLLICEEKTFDIFLFLFCLFEEELHARTLLELILIFEHNPIDLSPFVILIILLFLSFEDKELVLFLSVCDQIFTSDDGQVFLTSRQSQTDDLVWFPGLRLEQFDGNFTALFICIDVEHEHSVHLCEQENVHGCYLENLGAFETLTVDWHFQVVHVFLTVNVEARLARLVCNAVQPSFSKHHLGAPHVVVHHILQMWHQSVTVHQVEVNVVGGCQLNPNVSLDEIDERLFIDLVIFLPVPDILFLC